MTDKKRSSGKKPVSQKRVATVLAALVGTLTLSAGILLLMEGGAGGATPMAAAVDNTSAASALIEPATPLRQSAWDYIIIYESGDLAASCSSLADGRVTGGSQLPPHTVRPKANFHFVIGNASNGGMDGAAEVGTAWQNQIASAPYAGWPDPRYYSIPPYTNAIGICLDADLDRQPVSDAQNRTLTQVVHELQTRLNIPREHVLFQWDPRLSNIKASPKQKEYADYFRSILE